MCVPSRGQTGAKPRRRLNDGEDGEGETEVIMQKIERTQDVGEKEK